MKLRESGMPEETYWESLFDVPMVIDRLGIDNTFRDVVELGCGYGTFTLGVASRIYGVLTTFDVDEAMVERTRFRAGLAGIRNIVCEKRDVFRDGFGMEAGSQNACLLFNILHGEEPVRLLAEAARVLRPGGMVLVIHWRHDPSTPRGPAMDIRPQPDQIYRWARQTPVLQPVGPPIDLPPWHFGLRLQRTTQGHHA